MNMIGKAIYAIKIYFFCFGILFYVFKDCLSYFFCQKWIPVFSGPYQMNPHFNIGIELFFSYS